ncbi:MAG: response regulator [Clostridiales bacterium]|uniref:Stage 0 sporulation protein A homolog n=1 Tax=Candidatus Pullilachnospira stercoravium TaxID=2840913 RepID=A0A9D1T7W3_9FIRM|nr:response regulator [Clostridiales bacterium]HIV13918.1 response regulator [Candidatus Pullilachnospira stercoravium]
MSGRETILIVDDMEINRAVLCETFKDSCRIMEAENGKQALEYVLNPANRISAVLLDIVMPVMDGFEFLEMLHKSGLAGEIPVFLITADTSDASMRRGYNLGVMDIIEKPIVPYFVKKRVESVMELFRARRKLNRKVQVQSDQIRQQEREILELNQAIIETLSTAIEFRSGESGSHVKRIRRLTGLFLEELKRTGKSDYQFTDEQIEEISLAAIMHDVGKISISDAILNKPGKLTSEEFEIMKTHTVKGSEILELIPQYKEKDLYHYAYEICRYHHERWDGKGYPDHLKGDEIPIWAQVVSIADVVDALTNKRVYKPAIPFDEAAAMIRDGQCGCFNPDLLEALDNCSDKIRSGNY